MKNIDYKLFIVVVLLIVFGAIMISSVSVYSSYKVTYEQYVSKWLIKTPYNYFYLVRSIFHIVVSLLIMWFVTKVNYSFFEKYAKYFLIASWVMLIYVLIVWAALKWAKWWISIPWIPFLIQPTEFLKVSLIIFLAAAFKKYNHNLRDFKKWFLPFLWIMSVVVILVGLQPDFWTLMVLLPVTTILFFFAWANIKHILSMALLWICLIAIVYKFWEYDPNTWKNLNKLGYITQRIDNYLADSESAIKNSQINDQTKQWLITIWSGWFGWKWFWQSIQKFWYLPEVQWDFIFAVIVEELGFRWWLILLLVYLYLWYRWFYIAYNVRDNFAKYADLGLTSWFLFQSFINVWVNLNIVPLTWVTLPFISYGWSSLLALCIWVWIILSISRDVEEKPAYARMNKNKFIF